MPTLHLNDGAMSYHIAGPAQASAVVFIHGLSSDHRDWEFNAPVIGQRHRVITLDLRGHGKSSRCDHYSVPLFADDVAMLIESLNLGAVHMVGASMGGMIAQQLTLDHPSLVRSLTLINTVASTRFRSVREVIEAYVRFGLLCLAPMRTIGERAGPILFPLDHQKHLRQRILDQWMENARRDVVRVTYGLKDWSVDDRLGEIHCPVLVVRGDHDRLFKREDTQRIAQLVPHGRFVEMIDSGHCTPLDQPERFNQLLLDFIAEVDA